MRQDDGTPDDAAPDLVEDHDPDGAAVRLRSAIAALLGDLREDADPLHLEVLPASSGVEVALPEWLPESLLGDLEQAGITSLWRHQSSALTALQRGEDVVIATGTASGKSLVYQIAALTEIDSDDSATVLYLSPTKALGHDQARAMQSLSPRLRVGVLDGDTDADERDWIRNHAHYVVSNPDLLNASLLPRHQRWQRLLSNLRLIVVDECHSYRGVFGAHVALILRRLLRLARHYGGEPLVVAASATTGSPAESAGRLCGRHMTPITHDYSAHGVRTIVLAQPAVDSRITTTTIAADLLSDVVAAGLHALAFVPSRRGVEYVALRAQETLERRSGSASEGSPVLAYRAGFLPEERREIERRLRDGTLRGVATTNALELGVDIAGLDAVIICGWPGRRASFWQQAGRAGRGTSESVTVLLAGDDPLDAFLVSHPDSVFGQTVEETVFDPTNPRVLGPHLCAAAAELPLSADDLRIFGPTAAAVAEDLVAAGQLRARPRGLFWTRRERPGGLNDLRSMGGNGIRIVERDTGRLLGTVDRSQAGRSVHEGAVYIHQGATYLVAELDLADGVAIVTAANLDFTTSALTQMNLGVLRETRRRPLGVGMLHLGEVSVTSEVTGYVRRRERSGEILSSHPLDLPPSELVTVSCWWTVPDPATESVGAAHLAGAAHAAEHAAIGLLPLVASCDRWDVGGLSCEVHPDTGELTVFIYDGYPGGAGFAQRGYEAAETWLAATRSQIDDCPCDGGCPRCVQSPKCGNGNEPLDKAGAVDLLSLLVT